MVTAIQCSRWAEGLNIEDIFNERIISEETQRFNRDIGCPGQPPCNSTHQCESCGEWLVFDDVIGLNVCPNSGENADSWYWDGDPYFHLEEQRKKIRRRLEDRIRKDTRALYRAWVAVFTSVEQ